MRASFENLPHEGIAQVPGSATDKVIEPASQYVGSHVILPGSNPQPNLLLAFEYDGGWRDVKGAVRAA